MTPRADETAEEYRERLNGRCWFGLSNVLSVGFALIAGATPSGLLSSVAMAAALVTMGVSMHLPRTGKQLDEHLRQKLDRLNAPRPGDTRP